MNLVDLAPLTAAVERIASELQRIRQILEPQSSTGGQGFRSGYADPSGRDESSLLETDEFKAYTKEMLEKVYGRPLLPEEEAEVDGVDPNFPIPQDSPHTAMRVVDGFSRGLDLDAIRAEEKG